MTISLRVEHGAVVFPEGLCPPDGTVVQIVLPEKPARESKLFSLPTFKGTGLQQGVDLADPESLWRALDADKPFSPLP